MYTKLRVTQTRPIKNKPIGLPWKAKRKCKIKNQLNKKSKKL